MPSTVISNPTTVSSPVVQYIGPDAQLGSGVGTVGAFGNDPVSQPTSASVTNFATLKTALQNLGWIGSGTGFTPGNFNNTIKTGAGSLGTVVGGTSYIQNVYDLVPLTGGNGTGAKAMINVLNTGAVGTNAADLNVNIVVGGQGYQVGDVLSATPLTGVFSTTGNGSGFTVAITSLQTNGPITKGGVATTSTLWSGINYVAATYTGVPLTNGLGTGAVATVVVGVGTGVTSVTITSAGTGYAVGDELSASPASLGVVSNDPTPGNLSGGFLVKVATIS